MCVCTSMCGLGIVFMNLCMYGCVFVVACRGLSVEKSGALLTLQSSKRTLSLVYLHSLLLGEFLLRRTMISYFANSRTAWCDIRLSGVSMAMHPAKLSCVLPSNTRRTHHVSIKAVHCTNRLRVLLLFNDMPVQRDLLQDIASTLLHKHTGNLNTELLRLVARVDPPLH